MTSALRPEAPPDFRGRFRTDALARDLYAEAAGISRVVPSAVAVPVDAEDVAALVRWARRQGVSVIPRGSGSSMAGGAVGPDVIVDLSRFTEIGAVDVDARTIRVGAGALRDRVDAAARSYGLSFPVDPSSGAFCTIGGMIATNAAGARTLRYGTTRGWVRGLYCVFEDGSASWVHRDAPPPRHIPAVARLMDTLDALRSVDLAHWQHRGVRKESSGFAIAEALMPGGHLLDLLVGSEGTLALFTEAELALAPVPLATATVLATFASLDDAAACAVEARAVGARACELLDRTFLEVAATGGVTGIPTDADAVLLIEVEGPDMMTTTHDAEAVASLCRRHRAADVLTAVDPEAEHHLWALRHAASPILSRLAPRVRSMQFIEDGCVPPARFADYVRGVRAILTRSDTPGVIFGHAGDAHAHVNPLVDVTRHDWRDRVCRILDEVTDLTAALGGTLAGEHGDGRLRAPLLHRVWSTEACDAFLRIKQSADPHDVLNRGCKVATGTTASGTTASGTTASGTTVYGAVSDSIGTVKYDPAAAPLTSRARDFLDAVERDRAWHRFRLEGAA
jgi:FAD/FMN-containing dehydrogenase